MRYALPQGRECGPSGRDCVLVVSIISLLIGICFAGWGCSLRQSVVVSPVSRQPGESEGFVPFVSWGIVIELSLLKLLVDRIDVNTSSAWVTLLLRFNAGTAAPSNVIVVGLQVPHEFSPPFIFGPPFDLKATDDRIVSPAACGYPIVLKCINAKDTTADVSYFYVVINRTLDSRTVFTSFDLNMTFQWQGSLVRKSYEAYELEVQLSFSLRPTVRHEIPYEVRELWPSSAEESKLSIHMPLSSTITVVTPPADSYTYVNGSLWHIWDTRLRSEPDRFASTAFSVQFLMNDLAAEKEQKLFYGGLFLGIGVTMVVGWGVEMARTACLRRKTRS